LAAQGAAPVQDKIVELVVSNKTAEAGNKLHSISNDDLLLAILSTESNKLKAVYEAEFERRTLLA